MPTKKDVKREKDIGNMKEILNDCIEELKLMEFKAIDSPQVSEALAALEIAEDRMFMLLLRF